MYAGFVLSGYFQGKRNAEHAMAEAYPDQGVCLRPGFIHGTRYVSGGVGIPLSTIGVNAIIELNTARLHLTLPKSSIYN